MATRFQERRSRGREHDHRAATRDAAETDAAPQHREHEDLKHELDDLLDDIDAVLEQNAEEFVAAYVQRGGE